MVELERAAKKTLALMSVILGCSSPPASATRAAVTPTIAAREADVPPPPGTLGLALPTRCLLSPDGASLALARGVDVELWSIDRGLQRWKNPVARSTPSLTFSADGSVLFVDDQAFEASRGRSVSAKREVDAPKSWSANEGGIGVRLPALEPEAAQRLTSFATKLGVVVGTSDAGTTVAPRDPQSEIALHPSDDGRVLVVTGRDPKSPLRQGFAAGIDLETGKTWRAEAWMVGGGSSTSELLYGRSPIRGAKVRVSWGKRSDRVVLASEYQAGFEVRANARLYDARSGTLLRDLPIGAPAWSETGALLVAGDIVHAGGGAPSHGTWSNVRDAAWSANDERFTTLTSSGCAVYDVKSGALVGTAPSFVASPPGLRGTCVGRDLLTVGRDHLARWNIDAASIAPLAAFAPDPLARLQLDPSAKFAMLATSEAIVRVDLKTFAMARAELTTSPASKDPPVAALAPGGERFALASAPHVELRAFADAPVVRTKQALRGSIEALAWSFDGARVLAVTREPRGPRVYVIDTATGAVSEQLRGKLGGNRVDRVDEPRFLATHPSEPRAAIAIRAPNMTSGKSAVIVWNYLTNEVVLTFVGRVHTPGEIAFTPDGDLYLSTPSETALWNERTGMRAIAQPLRLDLDDVARLGVEALTSRWKSAPVPPGVRSTAYCSADGERVHFEEHRVRMERPDGAQLSLFRVRHGSDEGLLLLDARGNYDGATGVEAALRPPTNGAPLEIGLATRLPKLAQTIFTP